MLKILKLMTVTELDSIISEIISENEDTIFNYFNLLTSRIIINKITDMKIIPIEMIDDNYYHFNL
jgi:predicted nucleic acid-binding OB-fold protein